MKKIYLRSFMVIALSAMIISCSKKENATPDPIKESSHNQSSSKQNAVLSPYNIGEVGKDAKGAVKQPKQADWNITLPSYPFTFIDNPIPEYVKETCLVDISSLEYKKSYHKLHNGTLTIGFFDVISANPTRLLKLKSGNATGWNAEWGISPYVEQETPDLLYYDGSRGEKLVISLSKPCVEFGFEIAANDQTVDHSWDLLVGDYTYDGSKGFVSQTTMPGGARLIMVKSTKPFTTVTFGSGDSPSMQDIQGLAIANIRYKLAK